MTDEHVDLIASLFLIAAGFLLFWWGQNWQTAGAALLFGVAVLPWGRKR